MKPPFEFKWEDFRGIDFDPPEEYPQGYSIPEIIAHRANEKLVELFKDAKQVYSYRNGHHQYIWTESKGDHSHKGLLIIEEIPKECEHRKVESWSEAVTDTYFVCNNCGAKLKPNFEVIP